MALCTVQKAFQYETRMDHECDSTLWRHLWNEYKTPSCKPWKLRRFRQVATCLNTLVRAEPWTHYEIWPQETRNIAASYGLKDRQTIISFCHNTRVWQTDRRTDGRTDGHMSIARARLYTQVRANEFWCALLTSRLPLKLPFCLISWLVCLDSKIAVIRKKQESTFDLRQLVSSLYEAFYLDQA